MTKVVFDMPWVRPELVAPPYLFRAYGPLVDLLVARKADILAHVEVIARYKADVLRMVAVQAEQDPATSPEPRFDDEGFMHWDACALYAFVRHYRPRRIVEIGSGASTKLMRRAARDEGLSTHITSIGPEPRQDVDGVCDVVLRSYYEDTFEGKPPLSPGDFLFYDGSHFVLPHSDLVVHVLEMIPRMPSGVFLHFHDVFVPEDLPPTPAWRDQNWMETYVVGAMLLYGKDQFDVLLANRALCSLPELSVAAGEILSFDPSTKILQGGASLWLRKR